MSGSKMEEYHLTDERGGNLSMTKEHNGLGQEMA